MWTFKSFHMVNRESLWTMVAVAQSVFVRGVCMVCSAFTVASGSDAIQMCRKMRAAVDLASSWKAAGFFRGRSSLWSVGVLRGYHRGMSWLCSMGKINSSSFPLAYMDWHWQTRTICRFDGLQKVAGAPKKNLVDESFWWKESLESVSTSYTFFCFRYSNNLTRFLHIKTISRALHLLVSGHASDWK